MSQSAAGGLEGRLRTTPEPHPTAAGESLFEARMTPRRGYTPFQNQLWDLLPSAASVGVYLYLRSLPAGAPIGRRELAEVFREGRDSLGRVLDELMAAGLLVRVLHQGGSGQFLTRYVVLDAPVGPAEVVSIAAEQDTVHMVVPTCLARPLYKLGLHFQVHTNATVTITGFTSDTRTLEATIQAVAEPDDETSSLVPAGYGFPDSGFAQEESDSEIVTGSGFPASLQGTNSSDRSLPPTPQPAAASMPIAAATGEGGIHATCETPDPSRQVSARVNDAVVVSEASDEAVDQVMRAVVGTYGHTRFSPDHLRGLAAGVRERLAGGHTVTQLKSTLTSNPDGMRIPGRALIRRLDGLDERDQLVTGYVASAAGRTWCGVCHQQTRMLEVDHGAAVRRCPACHPNATPAQARPRGFAELEEPEPAKRKQKTWRELLAEETHHATVRATTFVGSVS